MRKSVFIVYGHDIEMRTAVKGYLTSRDIAQVSLEGPTNGSNTVIEEFEERADPVSDAIVLLSPDDLNDSGQKKRPRQNVMFEFGYFYAKLKRRHVMVLKKEGVEIPSDIEGVLTGIYRKGSWASSLDTWLGVKPKTH